MGRVAKYKKVKAFDRKRTSGEYIWGENDGRPTKKKRSKTAEKLKQNKLKRRRGVDIDRFNCGVGGYDLPPSGKDEFNLSDFKVKKIKKQNWDDGLNLNSSSLSSSSSAFTLKKSDVTPKAAISNDKVKVGNRSVTCTIPKDDKEERKMAKSLNIDLNSGKSKSNITKTIHERQAGESKTAFKKRMKQGAIAALAQDFKNKNSRNANSGNDWEADAGGSNRQQKRKESMKQKKLKKKKGVAVLRNNDTFDDRVDNDMNYEKGFITGENAVAAIPSFLEQAEAPPSFDRLPRGAVHKKLTMKMKNGMDDKSIKAEQDAMEAMRRKVQAQYSLLKAKRRQEGSFHL